MRNTLVIILTVALFVSACGPVNRLTRLQKLPREYSDNYSVDGIKAPVSEVHRKPWVVYSDRAGNAAYVNPGGKVKTVEINPLDAFLVIKRKGDYLRLIKYKPENIKKNRLDQRKKADYIGWVHSSRLILSPSSITDVRSGLHDKLLTAITDTSAILSPERFLATADSLKVFSDPDLQKQSTVIGMHSIVYALKYSPDGRSVLVAKTPEIQVDKIGEQVVGWVPKVMVKKIGRQTFVETSLAAKGTQPDVLRYSPVIQPYDNDSASTFKSGLFLPVIDKSGNKVFNIDGRPMSYQQSEVIKDNLKKINVLFSMEYSSHLSEQYPQLLNAIQNLRPLFSVPGQPQVYRFGGAIATGQGIEVIPLATDYEAFVDRMIELASLIGGKKEKTLPAWTSMKKALAMLGDDSEPVSLIIEIGEKGDVQEAAPTAIVEALSKKNCRLLGWQLYTSNEELYNNYTLQLSDMIRRYADYQTLNKRKILLYADQFIPSNLMREVNTNFFMLDYAYASMSQGGFLFPEKGELLPVELFAGAVDSLLTQIRVDHNSLAEHIERAFSTVGNTKDRLDSTLVNKYHLPKGMKPGKEFKKMFADVAPVWYKDVPRMAVPDSLMRYHLLLSEPEQKLLKERMETLCAMEVDIKDKTKPKKGKTKKLCRYLEETENRDEEESDSLQVDVASKMDTVYVSTRKVRRHLYNFYMSELRSCKVCRLKRKEIRRYSLAFAHRQIFGVPANGALLEDITVKGLKKHKKLSDAELDALIAYFKYCKEEFGKKGAEEQLSSAGQEYFYIDSKLLP
ncbi:type VI secretion system protein TssR domain-containing protein [Bacteroides sp.]